MLAILEGKMQIIPEVEQVQDESTKINSAKSALCQIKELNKNRYLVKNKN